MKHFDSIPKNEWILPILQCSEKLFIADDETKEILWSNDPSVVGEFCYKAFFAKDEVCRFCPSLKEGEFYPWDYYDKNHKCWVKIKHINFKDGDKMLRAGNLNLIDDAMSLNHDSITEISFLQKLLDENKSIKNKLEQEATHDRMTGLLNRNCFNNDVAAGKFNGENTGVLYFDLNNLKMANDLYRHEAGDELIKRLAAAISQTAEQYGTSYFYRVGGDEFVMIINNCSSEKLPLIKADFNKILDSMQPDTELKCVTAVGFAHSDKKCDIEALVSIADNEMYKDKKRLKGQN